MSSIITMATQITHDNYPVVAACLPMGFLKIPPSEVIGGYLVINEISHQTNDDETTKSLTVQNWWYDELQFSEFWARQGDTNPDTGFFEVSALTVR